MKKKLLEYFALKSFTRLLKESQLFGKALQERILFDYNWNEFMYLENKTLSLKFS